MKHLKKLAIGIAIALVAYTHICIKSDDDIRSRVVTIRSSTGLCSGEQVKAPSGVSYILTAAHCKGLVENGMAKVITEDGKELYRRVIEEDPTADLLLLEGLPGIDGLDIAAHDYAHEQVFTYTHGKGLPTYKTQGVLVSDEKTAISLYVADTDELRDECKSMPKNELISVDTMIGEIDICVLKTEQTSTTAFVTQGSSGGPVVDWNGDLVGVVSAGDGTFGFLVTLHDIRVFLSNY